MKKLIKLILLLTMMGIIFYFSSQPSNDSTVSTNFVIDIIYKFYKYIFSNGMTYEQFFAIWFKPIRKIAHFSEYALLSTLVYINVKEYFHKYIILYSVLFSFLYACTDEFHQSFVPGRSCSFVDVLIDSSGAICMILLIHFISKKCSKKY